MKYYSVQYLDNRDGLVKDWCTWDDPNNEEYRGHLDLIIRAIHTHGTVLDVSIIEEE